ncbi:MAG: hypothetical protein NEA02_15385 [Thermoanaerobaculia bacterium]|nr:hypothetical protein [Thermoanaerobaculia bacterium]
MRMKPTRLTLSAALLALAAGVPFAGPAIAQPHPPAPPGMPAPPMIGDLHVRIVPQGPPRRQREVRTARPGRNHVWQSGFWHHTGSDWAWNGGRWLEPPRARAHWVGPRYKRVRGGYQYIPGHWSHERVIYR